MHTSANCIHIMSSGIHHLKIINRIAYVPGSTYYIYTSGTYPALPGTIIYPLGVLRVTHDGAFGPSQGPQCECECERECECECEGGRDRVKEIE